MLSLLREVNVFETRKITKIHEVMRLEQQKKVLRRCSILKTSLFTIGNTCIFNSL